MTDRATDAEQRRPGLLQRVVWDRRYWAVSPAADISFIIVPLTYLTLVPLLLQSPVAARTPEISPVLALFSEVFFGNTSHVGLTLLLLLTNSAMRAAPPEGLGRVLGKALTIAGVSAALFAGLYVQSPGRAMSLALPVVSVFAAHHNLAQARGFWVIYEHQLEQAPAHFRDPGNRVLLQTFLNVTLAAVWLSWFFTGDGAGTLLFRAPGWSMWVLAATLIALAIALSIRLLRATVVSGPQLLYLIRLSCYPVALIRFPWVAFAGLGAAHGLEYFTLTGRLVRRRQRDERGCWARPLARPLALWTIMGLFLIPGALGLLLSPGFSLAALEVALRRGYRAMDILIAPALCVWLGLTLSHFYLDRVLFRFRFPAVREAVLPYLDGRK